MLGALGVKVGSSILVLLILCDLVVNKVRLLAEGTHRKLNLKEKNHDDDPTRGPKGRTHPKEAHKSHPPKPKGHTQPAEPNNKVSDKRPKPKGPQTRRRRREERGHRHTL